MVNYARWTKAANIAFALMAAMYGIGTSAQAKCIGLRGGALAVRWYRVERCAAE
jgi:hypothetical protein